MLDNKSFQDVLSNRFYRTILEDYEVRQTNPRKINVLDAINSTIPVWTTNIPKTTTSGFRYCAIRLGKAISKKLNEPTCENAIHKLEVIDE